MNELYAPNKIIQYNMKYDITILDYFGGFHETGPVGPYNA